MLKSVAGPETRLGEDNVPRLRQRAALPLLTRNPLVRRQICFRSSARARRNRTLAVSLLGRPIALAISR